MKKLILICSLVLSNFVYAAEGDMGIGVVLGNPTGVTGKYWLSGTQAVDGAVGMSIGKHTDFSMHSDYLLHEEGALFFNDDHPLDLYYGIGARIEFSHDIELGARIPIGLSHNFEGRSDMFFEVAPILDFVGRTGVELSFGVGARYYFR